MFLKESIKKSLDSFKTMLPTLVGTLLLINLISVSAQGFYSNLFTGNYIKDSFIGALAGSISFGIPLTSYIIGGELLKQGVNLLAVTAFIMTWSTVGITMLPLEITMLGKRFALARNFFNFVFAIMIAIITVSLMNIV